MTSRTKLRKVAVEVLGLVDDRGRAPPNSERSSKWRAIERRHLASNPECAFCGKTKELNVHHVLPFQLFPDHELLADNLITLCHIHHLYWGHLGNWQWFNPLVRADAETWRFRLKAARVLMALAKDQLRK
jgi:hypothetical protein